MRGPEVLWEASPQAKQSSRLGRWCEDNGFASYDEAWRWSVAPGTRGEFWAAMARWLAIDWAQAPSEAVVAEPGAVTGYRWFPGGRLNYAQHALRPPPAGPAALAVIAVSQSRPVLELSWADLADLVGRARAALMEAGVGPGDTVAGYVPNVHEALVTMLACASLGALWASCAPEMGFTAALERLAQLRPVVLLAVDGYRYGAKAVPRREESRALRRSLLSVRKAVWLAYLEPGEPAPPGWSAWDEAVACPGELSFEAVPFDHPLYALFSSGTTGKPKAIVHGHGGMLLEHGKALGLHFDVGPGQRFFWFSTTGWMMWNFCVSSLLVGATTVLFDGDPTWPERGSLWDMMATTAVTGGGTSAAYLVACMKNGLRPGRDYDLSRLRVLGSTGSPLPAAAARWAYTEVGDDFMLGSFSGGTDVCTGFAGPSPLHPVWGGEISCRCLGAPVDVFSDEGEPVRGQEGELVLTGPLPSMPVRFWGDDGTRYREAYFERFPGTWAHGDRALLTGRGSLVITGRSDGTLKRGGVRMGTAEFYAVVEAVPAVKDSLVVHLEDPAGGPGEIWLFLVVDSGGDMGAEVVEEEARRRLRHHLSARHVPDQVRVVAAIPRTLSGKKLEVPVKRLLCGAPIGEVVDISAVANPQSLEAFEEMAYQRRLAAERPAL